MTRDLHTKTGEKVYDNLFASTQIPAIVRGGTIAKGVAEATYKRGTLLEKGADGKLYIMGTNAGGTATEEFNGDGSTKTFTLTASPLPLQVSAVVGTTATVVTYDAQAGTVTFGTAPAAGTKNVKISYEKAGANTPDCVLTDDVTVGTSSDENVTVYISGDFNTEKLIVAEGYTITEADKDALRLKNILLGTLME